eukprot:sb/3478148/
MALVCIVTRTCILQKVTVRLHIRTCLTIRCTHVHIGHKIPIFRNFFPALRASPGCLLQKGIGWELLDHARAKIARHPKFRSFLCFASNHEMTLEFFVDLDEIF